MSRNPLPEALAHLVPSDEDRSPRRRQSEISQLIEHQSLMQIPLERHDSSSVVLSAEIASAQLSPGERQLMLDTIGYGAAMYEVYYSLPKQLWNFGRNHALRLLDDAVHPRLKKPPAAGSIGNGYVVDAQPVVVAKKPPVIGKTRPYNEARKARIPGYDDHHLDPPLGRHDPSYSTGQTIPIRNDNAGGRVPGGLNYHTGAGGFHPSLNQHIGELGFSRTQWNALPDAERLIHLRRYYSSLGISFQK